MTYYIYIQVDYAYVHFLIYVACTRKEEPRPSSQVGSSCARIKKEDGIKIEDDKAHPYRMDAHIEDILP